MAKLSDLFQITPHISPIEVACELTPGEMSKTFVTFKFAKVVIAHLPEGDRAVEAKFEARVGKKAFQEFAYHVMQLAAELN